MSTILKALRRLEEEKAAAEGPRPLREQIASPPRVSRARRSGWLAAGVALVVGVGAGGGLIWSFFGGARTEVVAAAAPAAPAPTPVAPPAPPPAPAAAAAEPGPPEQAFESDVEIVDRPDALPRLADAEPVQPGRVEPRPGSIRPVQNTAAAERARQAALAEYNAAERARRGLPPEPVAPIEPIPPDPVPAIAQPEAEQAAPPAVPIASVAAPPTRAPAPAPAATPEPVAAPVARAPAPAEAPAAKVAAPKPAPGKLAARPAPEKEVRAAAAEPAPAPPPAPPIAISVEKTQWHPLADRRIAWLRVPGESDAKRVVEGDVVDGLIVSAIEPSGVVFEREGEKIRRALGSP